MHHGVLKLGLCHEVATVAAGANDAILEAPMCGAVAPEAGVCVEKWVSTSRNYVGGETANWCR